MSSVQFTTSWTLQASWELQPFYSGWLSSVQAHLSWPQDLPGQRAKEGTHAAAPKHPCWSAHSNHITPYHMTIKHEVKYTYVCMYILMCSKTQPLLSTTHPTNAGQEVTLYTYTYYSLEMHVVQDLSLMLVSMHVSYKLQCSSHLK